MLAFISPSASLSPSLSTIVSTNVVEKDNNKKTTTTTTTNNNIKKLFTYPPLSPPSPVIELALRKILLSGHCDCVARKVPPAFLLQATNSSSSSSSSFSSFSNGNGVYQHSLLPSAAGGKGIGMGMGKGQGGGGGGLSRRKRLTAYMSCDGSINTMLYIHPQSNLFKKVNIRMMK